MESRVELHPEAAEELQHAVEFEWYESRSPALGLELLSEFERAIEMIRERSLAWPRHVRGTRRFILHRFP